MFEIDFSTLTHDMKAIGLDVYKVKYPKLNIDDEIGEQLRKHFMMILVLQTGGSLEQAKEASDSSSSMSFSEQNKGRSFNFWHFVYDIMKKNSKAKYHPRVGRAVIKRNMVDPNEQEDLAQLFCYTYIAQGGKFAAPVIDKILDHYGVEEMKITTTFGD